MPGPKLDFLQERNQVLRQNSHKYVTGDILAAETIFVF